MEKIKKTELLKKIGKNCKNLRQRLGVSQSEMIKAYNFLLNAESTVKLISNFENGKTDNMVVFLLYYEMSARNGLGQMLDGINLDYFNKIDWLDTNDDFFKFNPYKTKLIYEKEDKNENKFIKTNK